MQKTSGEIEREFIEGLENATGRTLDLWLKTIEAGGIRPRNDVIAWLKSECGFGHMNASLLASISANGGKPVYADTGELLENQLSKAEDLRPLFAALLEFLRVHFPDSTVLPKKTYVSILEKREFAAINIRKTELRLGLDLGARGFDETVSKSKLVGPMPRISHQVAIVSASQLDGELAILIKDSYRRSN